MAHPLVSTVDLHAAYRRQNDPPFAALFAQLSDPSDDSIADLIEADGRLRGSRGLPVALQRYLDVVPDLASRPDCLDAAIDVTLRSISGSSRISVDAVQRLSRQHADLAKPIEEAAALNAAIWSTTGLRTRVNRPPPKSLPCDFGPPLETGQRRYVLKELLGQGAFGQVYLALDRQLSEDEHTALVAIKLLPSDAHNAAARQRIIDEAVKVRRISHPNVVQVLDRGAAASGEEYIVYEYVDGGDLGEALDRFAGRDIRAAASMVAGICRGVHAAHSAGVIHCDLKPGNIMLTSEDVPKVADFGIAVRLGDRPDQHADDRTERFGPIGNIAFISPEQYRGGDEAFSIPSDVYALGGMLYLLLTNHLPNGDTFEQIEKTHALADGRAEPPSPKAVRSRIHRDLDAICRRAMAVNPQERHPSAAALAEDLEAWLAGMPIEWMKPSPLHRLRLWMVRKPAVAAAVVVLLLVMGFAVRFYVVASSQKAWNQQNYEYEQQRRKFTAAIQKMLGVIGKDYRLNTEALMSAWAYEYVLGPKVIGAPDAEAALWIGRVHNLRQIVGALHEQGRADDVETLIWESALGYWLACDHEFKEAEPLLKDNLRKWSHILRPEDQWIADVQVMVDCAAANRLIDAAKTASADHSQTSELRTVATRLSAYENRMPRDHQGTALHYLLLDRLAELHGPNLLDQPEVAETLRAKRRTTLDPKTQKTVATAPASPAPSTTVPAR